MNYLEFKWDYIELDNDSILYFGYNDEYINLIIQKYDEHNSCKQYEGSFFNDSKYFKTCFIKDHMWDALMWDNKYTIDLDHKIFSFECRKGFHADINIIEVPCFNHPEFNTLGLYLLEHVPHIESNLEVEVPEVWPDSPINLSHIETNLEGEIPEGWLDAPIQEPDESLGLKQ